MTGNLLLDSLPEADLQKIQEKVKPVVLTARQVLSTQGELVQHVYFPTTGFISCSASGSQGELLEIYAVGHDGESAAILTSIAAVTAEVQIAGQAYRISIFDLCLLLNQTEELARVLLKYAYSLAVRMVQATKCAIFHTVKQRLVLWLLLANPADGKVIPCTPQSIAAEALGALRASVTLVLNRLAHSGIIETHPGRITIANRSGLEQASCDCFQLIKAGREPELECEIGA